MRQPLLRQPPHFVEPLELLISAFSCCKHIKVCNKYQDKSSMDYIFHIGVHLTHRYWLLRASELVDIFTFITLYVSRESASAYRYSMTTVSAHTDGSITICTVSCPMSSIAALFP
jgi:hypothetical protein